MEGTYPSFVCEESTENTCFQIGTLKIKWSQQLGREVSWISGKLSKLTAVFRHFRTIKNLVQVKISHFVISQPTNCCLGPWFLKEGFLLKVTQNSVFECWSESNSRVSENFGLIRFERKNGNKLCFKRKIFTFSKLPIEALPKEILLMNIQKKQFGYRES